MTDPLFVLPPAVCRWISFAPGLPTLARSHGTLQHYRASVWLLCSTTPYTGLSSTQAPQPSFWLVKVTCPTLRDHMHIHTPRFGVGWPRLASEVNDVHEQLTDLELRWQFSGCLIHLPKSG